MAPLAVIDPSVKNAETDAFNHIVSLSSVPATYHLPALGGTASLLGETSPSAVIVLGSMSSVHDNFTWQKDLGDWLMPKLKAGTPTLGICFGHQLICHLLGGKVEFIHPDKGKRLGLKKIVFSRDSIFGETSLEGEIFVSHREVVSVPPPQMDVIASSAEIKIEALTHRSLPIWTFTGHPEATVIFAKNQKCPNVQHESLRFGHSLLKSFLDFALRH